MERYTKYIKLLDRAYTQLPPGLATGRGRFEIPKPVCSIVGNRTIVHNFKAICEVLGRDPKFVLRFLSRELATAGFFDGSRAIFQGVFSEETIESIIKTFARDYVICPVCKRPDTKLQKEKRFMFLICEDCGATTSVRSF